MSKKIQILFLVLTFGFFLMPTAGFACGTSSKKISCEKKAISKKEISNSCQKDCCKKNPASGKDQHGCNGKCDHSGCTTSGLQFSLISENEFDFTTNTFNLFIEKPLIYYTENLISEEFISIWLPPKIE